MSIQRILIVDDDPLSREFLVEACKSLGLQTSQATHGREALASIEQSQPDLVITDLRMPEMTGT
ncbi:MAG: response regulator, partial [Planctomycetota bacterium]